jgi:hypothetical protein
MELLKLEKQKLKNLDWKCGNLKSRNVKIGMEM